MAPVLAGQFDVFRNDGPNKGAYPYIVVLQADTVDEGSTVAAAPLVVRPSGRRSLLMPRISLDGTEMTLGMTDLANVPRRILVRRVGNLEHERRRIIAALDFLFSGV